MGLKLPTSSPTWALILVFISISFIPMSKAVFDGSIACDGSDTVECDISHVDVWAGVSAFSDGFKRQSYVTVRQRAWVEWSPIAWIILQAFYTGAQWCADFFNYDWQRWKFQHDVVVTGGPSCCPFSVSGKRLRQRDPRSNQGMETAKLAVHFGALVLIVENVTNFVDEDNAHHLLEQMNEYLLLNGMVAIGVWKLVDS